MKELTVLKAKDWSLDVEDPYYAEHPEEIFSESLAAIGQTEPGRYINIVTPEALGHPSAWLIEPLRGQLADRCIAFRDILYVDECGCGGHVTRVYR